MFSLQATTAIALLIALNCLGMQATSFQPSKREDTPFNLLATEGLDSSVVHLRWQPSDQSKQLVTYFVVLYTTVKNGLNWTMEVPITNATNLTITGLLPDSTYFFKVKKQSDDGKGASRDVSYRTAPMLVTTDSRFFVHRFRLRIGTLPVILGTLSYIACMIVVLGVLFLCSTASKDGKDMGESDLRTNQRLWFTHHQRVFLKGSNLGTIAEEPLNAFDCEAAY